MALFKRGGIWWYKFYFAGQFIRESSKSSSKTVAKNAEQQRRRELETGFHNLKEVRQQRIRRLNDIVDEYLVGYRLRYRSATFAEYALGHVSRLLGAEMSVDIDDSTVLRYQENRLREQAAPKSINEEVRFLLKMLGRLGRGHSVKAPQEEATEAGGPEKDRQSVRYRRDGKPHSEGEDVTQSAHVPGFYARS